MAFLKARSSLRDQICAHQFENARLCMIGDKVLRGEAIVATIDSKGILRINCRVFVPMVGDWVRMILEEAHYANYSIHSSMVMMYYDLKQHYWLFSIRET